MKVTLERLYSKIGSSRPGADLQANDHPVCFILGTVAFVQPSSSSSPGDESTTLRITQTITYTKRSTRTHFTAVHLDEVSSVCQAVAEVREQVGEKGEIDFVIGNAAILGGDEKDKTKG